MEFVNSKISFGAIVLFAVVFAIFMPATAHAATAAPAPAPTSDGRTVDQGIAVVLMLLALVLTYIIHAVDVPFASKSD